MRDPATLHPIARGHLEALTDDIGIMQHAIGREPDPAHGYCTDDVARALSVDLLHQRGLGWARVSDSAWRSLRYLEAAFDGVSGRFRNFRRVDGSWLDGPASEDSQGRAMAALGDAIAHAPDPAFVAAAATLFDAALPRAQGMTALRARASVLLGCDAAMQARPEPRTATAYRLLGASISAAFAPRIVSDWPWPESRLTYENALPVHALILAAGHLDAPSMLAGGLHVLDWLVREQTAPAGHLSPIGNEWWPCGGVKARFDQQPIEATSLLLAADAALTATGDERHRATMERAYAWFLGENDLDLPLAEPERGAGFDGLTPDGVNTNQGAESTLMWLTALERIRAVRPPVGAMVAGREPALVASS
ncbi:MAG TPA: hypothetical protein VF119_02345 [Candidatus Limnocylindrales bacterium]